MLILVGNENLYFHECNDNAMILMYKLPNFAGIIWSTQSITVASVKRFCSQNMAKKIVISLITQLMIVEKYLACINFKLPNIVFSNIVMI